MLQPYYIYVLIFLTSDPTKVFLTYQRMISIEWMIDEREIYVHTYMIATSIKP